MLYSLVSQGKEVLVTLPLRVYILETETLVKLALKETLKRFDVIGAFEELPPISHALSEADVVILDPRIFPGVTDPTEIVFPVWKRIPNRVQIILHAADWRSQEYRDSFRALGVARGIVREDYKRLFAILTKIQAQD